MATDPGERQPLALADAPPPFQALYEVLAAFVQAELAGEAGESVEPDPLLRQQLEALGYTN